MNSQRQNIMLAIILVMMTMMGGRLCFLHIFHHHFLQNQGDARALRTIGVPSYRGMITDRLGVPLAVSTPVDSVWANPSEVVITEKNWRVLAKIIKLEEKKLIHKLQDQKNHKKEFLYLMRQLHPDIIQKIKSLNLSGIHFSQEYRRYYPRGEATAHVVGLTNIDNQGREGLELAYDSWLTGENGAQQVLKDRLGRYVEDIGYTRAQRGGQDLALSVDHRIQFLAHKALSQAVRSHGAKAGSIVILDTRTNEVLALVNQPTFNPNQRVKIVNSSMRNRAVTDEFEPASVLKAFSVANILSSGRYKAETEVDTSPGWMKVGHHVVRDGHDLGRIDIKTMMQKSSNVGISKLTLSLPDQSLPATLMRVGFGQSTGSGFPGENTGRIAPVSNRTPFSLATLSFGYGVTTTPLQLAQAYSVLANRGIKRPVSFIRGGNENVTPERVMEADVAEIVTQILEQVVGERAGSGKRASLNGYTAAGKTGTSKKISAQGLYENKYVSLFAGFAPVENPRLVMVVMIDEPTDGKYYGGDVAAPVFSKVMSEALRVLDVPVSHSTSTRSHSTPSTPLKNPLNNPLNTSGFILARGG